MRRTSGHGMFFVVVVPGEFVVKTTSGLIFGSRFSAVVKLMFDWLSQVQSNPVLALFLSGNVISRERRVVLRERGPELALVPSRFLCV